ncbi:hypothetical protein ACPJHQ_04505 [Rossellomorea sp. H39__3]
MNTLSFKQFNKILNKYRPSMWVLGIAITLSIIQTGVALAAPLVAMDLVNTLVVNDFNALILVGLLMIFVIQVSLWGFPYT